MNLVRRILFLTHVIDARVVLIARHIFLHSYATLRVLQVVGVHTTDATLALANLIMQQRIILLSHDQPVAHTVRHVHFAGNLMITASGQG